MPPLELLLQQAWNGVMLGVMYALVAVGFTLFFGVLDVIHFAHGDIFMLGAFAGLTALVGLKAARLGGSLLALPLTFAAAILVTGVVGVAAERVCVKPLAGTSPLMTLLATLSLGLVIRESVLIFYPRGADPKPFPQLLQGAVAAHDLALAARLRGVQAEQTHVVQHFGPERVIRVEGALGAGDGEARAVADVLAGVAHVVQ